MRQMDRSMDPLWLRERSRLVEVGYGGRIHYSLYFPECYVCQCLNDQRNSRRINQNPEIFRLVYDAGLRAYA